MPQDRPTIEPAILATMIESAPGRVRRRLDKEPNVAETWNWSRDGSTFEVMAGEETVRIETQEGVIRTIEQLECTCLLAPKCHHILACLSVLDTADAEDAVDQEPAEPIAEAEEKATDTSVTPDMQRTASSVRRAAVDVLRVGARASGALLQSALLRTGHECRVTGLPMLGNTVLRIAEGIRRLRAQSDVADSALLRADLFTALLATELLRESQSPPAWVIGTSRREFAPVSVSQLQGWFAEPILTRSGYAGVCIHFLTPDGRMHQVTEMRPGDAPLVMQAYSGGIDLGTTTMQGSALCRKTLAVQNLTASVDGRLGKGKRTRWAVQGMSEFAQGAAAVKFSEPPGEQLNHIFRVADQPTDVRRGGWDLIAFEAQLLGAQGPALVARLDRLERPWLLRIAVDDRGIAFRENLELLARCPGLCLRCVGRVRIDAAGEIDLLAIGLPGTEPSVEEGDEPIPRLRLPDEWQGRCNLGMDRLQRHHIDRTSRWGVEVTLPQQASSSTDDGLAELDRRLSAVALGGHRAVPNIESAAHRRAVSAIRRRGHATAATLVDTLASAAVSASHTTAAPGTNRATRSSDFGTVLLACATYLQATRTEFHHQCWNQLLED